MSKVITIYNVLLKVELEIILSASLFDNTRYKDYLK